MFSVLLGSVTALDPNLFSGQDLSLGVQVGSDLEMVPRQPIARVPYAFQALSANTTVNATNASNLCSSGGVCKDYRNTAFAYGIVGSAGIMVNAFHLGSASLSSGT